MMRVALYSSESSGTWGLGCGKHGCKGPHGNSDAASSSSSPRAEAEREPIDVRLESGSETRDMSGLLGAAPASRSLSACNEPCAGGIAGPGVGGCEVACRLLRSRGRPMLVRPLMLSSPVERWTARDEGAGDWRLRRCCGRVSSGYSSRASERVPSTGRLGYSWRGADEGGGTGRFWTAKARGDELTGFQRRDAGWRGGPWYSERRFRLKMRFVSDQRAGTGDDGAGGADEAEGVRGDVVVMVVDMFARLVVVRSGLGAVGRGPCPHTNLNLQRERPQDCRL
jgi:hypothetical protein